MRRRLQLTILSVGAVAALGFAAAAIYAGQNAQECGAVVTTRTGMGVLPGGAMPVVAVHSYECSVTGWGTAEPYLWLSVVAVVALSSIALIATRVRHRPS